MMLKRLSENDVREDCRLALQGGTPVRTEPLPLEFPGVHYMGEEEVEAVARLARSRSFFRHYGISLQKEVDAFESEFAEFLGVSHAVAVSSGTGALNVALSALGVGPGQEVIIPAYLWVSVAAAVVNHGAIPVLADVDDTFCLNPASAEACIGSRTAGIILVHMSGAPGDVEGIREVARRHKLFFLEDCAQCNGGSVKGRRVGTFGEIATFSFQMNKNMTSGEGGCVVTNDARLYRRAFACHDLGYARDDQGRLIFSDPDLRLWGHGYRLDELRGAVLRVQLKKLPRIVESMRRSKYRIREFIKTLPGIQLRRIVDAEGDTGCFLITTYADRQTAAAFNEALRAEGIVTYPQGVSNVVMTDWGLHLYYKIPSLVERSGINGCGYPWTLKENAELNTRYSKGTCPVADSLFERSIILAIPSCLTERDEDDVIRAFEKVHRALLVS